MKERSSTHRSYSKFFLKHFARNFLLAIIVTGVLILIGILGFRYFEQTAWVDAYANVTMIISGVGMLTEPKTDTGKIFVGTYSLLGAGLFLIAIGVAFVPIFHWLFRQMHVEDREHNV